MLRTLSSPPASTSNPGSVQLATDAEAKAVTSQELATTPGNLAAVFAEPPALGSTTPAAVNATELNVATGTITASNPTLDTTQTWNNAGVTFTGHKANVTDAASAAGSLLMDLQVGGTSKLAVAKDGYLLNAASAPFASATNVAYGSGGKDRGIYSSGGGTINLSGGGNRLAASAAGVLVASNIPLGFATTSDPGLTGDVFLFRDAAAALAQRNGTNAQVWRLYGTYTDGSNYERLATVAAAAGDFKIIPEAAGTGTLRGLQLGVSGGKLGFYGTTAVTKPVALTAADAATVDIVYGNEEAGVIANLRTRLNELETKLQSLGLLA